MFQSMAAELPTDEVACESPSVSQGTELRIPESVNLPAVETADRGCVLKFGTFVFSQKRDAIGAKHLLFSLHANS